MRVKNQFTPNLDIRLNQGADFNLVIVVSDINGPMDLIGFSFLGEIKSSTSPSAPIVGEFEFTILDQFLYPGQVQWQLSSDETEHIMTSVSNALSRRRLPTPFLYDVKMKNNEGLVTRILQGTAYVSPEVTEEMFS